MRWMGGWSIHDYENAPAKLTDEILRVMEEEYNRIEAIRSKSKSRDSAFRVERDASGKAHIIKDSTASQNPPATAPTAIDPRTGREIVTKVKEDGTVVTHRVIEPGEALIHTMFGKPKSFQGK